MVEQSKKKHKKNKRNEVIDAGISETEQEGNGAGVKGSENLDKVDVKEKKKHKKNKRNEVIDAGISETEPEGNGAGVKGSENLDKVDVKEKKKHKKNKRNGVIDAGISETEQEGNGAGVKGSENLGKVDVKDRQNYKVKKREKDNPKKKKVIEDSYKGIVERKKTDEKEQVRNLVIMEDRAGNVNEKLGNKKKKRGKDNDHLNVSDICGDVNQQDKQVETVQRVSDGDPVGKVGKKKRKRERNKCVHDEGASWEDNTQLTESRKEDMESQNGEHLAESNDDGHKGDFIDELGKKKKKRKKGKEIDAQSAAREGILVKKSNPVRADSTMDEEQDKNMGIVNAKGKSNKEKSIKNGSQDSKSPKSSKKVRFSTTVEVFPSSEVVPNGNEKNKDSLVRGKRFSKEEDEIVRQAVLNYIEENCLGDEGLTMVLNCRSHPKVLHCWKEIGACLPYRPYVSVYLRAQVVFRRSKDRKWTKEECEYVREFYNKNGPKWRAVADELGKHRWHVKDTWRRIKLANRKKGQWNQEEYQNLFNLVNKDLLVRVSEEKKSKCGMLRDNICWSGISETLETRSDAACCMKWYNQLSSPMVAEGKWTDADDYRLINALYQLDASCLEDVNWDNLVDHRSGDVCRKRWKQMVLHIGQHATKSFAEQVEVLATRYCPDLLDAKLAWDNKPCVD